MFYCGLNFIYNRSESEMIRETRENIKTKQNKEKDKEKKKDTDDDDNGI
jgi:hypothetical protein